MEGQLRNRYRPSDWQFSSTIEELEAPVINGSDIVRFGKEEDVLEKYSEFECQKIKTPRIFHETKKAAKEMKDALNCLANQIAVINKKGNKEKVEGSAWSFTGSLMGIGGTLLAPVTFGGSLVLTAAGVAISVKGSVVSSKAENEIATQTNQKVDYSRSLLGVFNEHMSEWNEVAELLSEIVEELRDLFSDLEFRFCNMLGSIENCTHKDESSYKVECFLKCVSNFYGVAKTSTHVVRNVDKITRLAMRVRHIRTIVLTGKKVGDVAKTAKGVVVQIALGKPNCFLSTTKQVVNTGRQVVTTVKRSETVTKTAKVVSLAADGSGKVVQTEKAVQLVGNTVTKETVTVTKTVSKIGLGLGVVFAAVDLYQLGSAIKASESTSDAEKELRSCIKNIKEITDQVVSQLDVYKEVMRIKMFFESLLQYGREMVFGSTSLPHERVRSCIDKINDLHNIMN